MSGDRRPPAGGRGGSGRTRPGDRRPAPGAGDRQAGGRNTQRRATAAAAAATDQRPASGPSQARRSAARVDETGAFLDDGRPPSALNTAKKRGRPVGSEPPLDVDEETTRFYGRAASESPRRGRPPEPPDPGDDLDTVVDDFEHYGSGYDPTTGFDSLDDFDREPTPALLAAKAEPLGGAAPSRRPNRKPTKSSRTRASEAARVSKARQASSRKPKEPSKVLLGAGLLAVLLAGFATAYFLTRDGSGDTSSETDAATLTSDPSSDTTSAEAEGDANAAATSSEPAGPATGLPPVVIFDEAAIGPIDAGVSYSVAVGEGPGNAMYQLLVDGEAQADPAPELPPVVFAPGRHLLVVDITSPDGNVSTDPVLVYAVGELPAVTWRANLSSVNVETEGWAEAVRQFEDFVSAGHTELQLMPSDRFPALTPGYWNLYIGGFDDNAAATAYCEQYGLTVPDQCFPQLADPNAAAGG